MKIYKFVSYHRYYFTFKAADGDEIIAGGDLENGKVKPEMTLKELAEELGDLKIIPSNKLN